MRIGEILALQKKDIDFEKNIIKVNRTLTKDENDSLIVGKTTKTYAGLREIPILGVLKPVLLNYKCKTNYLFLKENGGFISATTLNTYTSVFDKYKKDEFEKIEKYLEKI